MHVTRILAMMLTTTLLASEVKTKRYPVPAKVFHPENGFCFIATMDFGEDGDKSTKNRSGLILYENGKPLGPARSLHADIRTKGTGRYSHWGARRLYMSASDNSDPRTNGRTYEVASTNPESMLGGRDITPDRTREHVEVIRNAQHEYTVNMGGKLDFENCRTQRNDSFEVVFQPNLSLTIENTGKTTVDWPRIVANDRGDWGTLESLVSEYTRGAKTDMEKALFLWQGTRQNRYHCIPLFADDEFHDPVKLFNSYGLNLCDDLGYGGMALFKQAGLGKPVQPIEAKVRALHGHVQGEAVVDGRYAFIDIDEGVFHLDRENERLIDGDACAHDHDLVRREVHYGPTFGAWSSSESNAALFGDDDISVFKLVQGHTMRYGLRPGEKIVFRWDNVGKYACQSEKWNRKPPYFGNSKLIYSPPLTRDRRKEGILELHNAKMLDGAVVGTAADGRVVFEFRSAWAICGGRVIAEFANGKAGLLIHPDGGKASAVWEGDGGKADVSIDKALQTHLSPAKYRYTVTAKLAKGARLNALRVETDIMTAPMSLPRLRLGENRIVYADQNKEPREITVTHRWTECDRITPPPPPDAPTYPQPDALCRDTFLDFRWPEVSDARAYHLQVSLRPDFRVPYRPSYDVIVRQNSWRVPFRGMFSSGVLYHWRLRTQSKRGIWSEWSSSWTFRWEGPRVPVNLKVEQLDDGFQLFWSANPRGERPVAYDVYGSDEKGFPVHKKAYSAYCRGKAPANFLARTTSTSMRISDPDPSHPNRNRCYYRVVAVDANGTEGISSAYVELPHPHMWSRPDTTCEVGKRWEYPVGIISSLGDAQHRRKSPTNGFWDKEIVTLELVDAPAWLKLDAEKRLLAGIPPTAGKAKITLRATTQTKKTCQQTFTLTIR